MSDQVTISPNATIVVQLSVGPKGISSALYPQGSSAYSSGGQYPSCYTIKNPAGTIIGYVNLSYDGSNRVTEVVCKNASNATLTNGSWTISYDDSGNLISAVCNG